MMKTLQCFSILLACCDEVAIKKPQVGLFYCWRKVFKSKELDQTFRLESPYHSVPTLWGRDRRVFHLRLA